MALSLLHPKIRGLSIFYGFNHISLKLFQTNRLANLGDIGKRCLCAELLSKSRLVLIDEVVNI